MKTLQRVRDEGRKLLVTGVTGGLTPDWAGCLSAYVDAGADAIEVGLPFSDPTLDGRTIQEASDRALSRGASWRTVLSELSTMDIPVPVYAMTYANLVLQPGFREALAAARVTGLIVPDVPLAEIDAVNLPDLDLVLLAAPSTPRARLDRICARSRGFVYAVSVMGTTGERDALPPGATDLVVALKDRTELPVLLGFGVSTAAQAREASRTADGVVVASALMRRMLDGAGPAELGTVVRGVREGLDREG